MTDARNDGVTSIKVQAGCTFTAYKDPNQEGLMTSITSDTSTLANNDASLDLNDQLSSYVCTCGGDCSCGDFVTADTGLGMCQKDFNSKGPICYVNEPSTCSDLVRGSNTGRLWSREACSANQD